MYSDVQMSFRKSERSMQTSNNKISVFKRLQVSRHSPAYIGLLRLVAYRAYKVSEF